MRRKVYDSEAHAHFVTFSCDRRRRNIYSFENASEKLEYIHNNPVRKGLAANAHEWSYGSAGRYLLQRPVGIKIVPLW